MPTSIDLIADIGEGFGDYTISDDQAMLDVISSANVACGFHAGDPMVMDATVRACRQRGVAVGAHPGYGDRVGFGRRTIDMSREEITTDVLYQIGALSAFVRRHDLQLQHVMAHGRMGNLTVVDDHYAAAVLDAVTSFDPDLIVVGQEGKLLERARKAGHRVGVVGFGDRAYENDGLLVDRRQPGAVIHDPDEVADRVVGMVTTGTVQSRHGAEVEVPCDTVLLHGDTQGAVEIARKVRTALEAADVTIAPIHTLV